MTSLNRVILAGTVVTPPRRHYRPDGSAVIQFPLELSDSEEAEGAAPDRCGGKQGRRNRIDVVAVGKLAEGDVDFLQSGRRVVVVGRLNQRRWQTPEGRNRTQTEVIATSLQTIEENGGTRPSIPHLEADACSELTLGRSTPNLQRRGLRSPNGQKRQGE